MRIAITGGTGFVGSHITRRLLAAGHEVVQVARGKRPHAKREGVTFAGADVVGGKGLDEALAGCDAVVNLVAVIKEKGSQTFDSVNRQGTEKVAQAAKRAGVRHLVQLSAIGADPDPDFPYLASKWAGEQAVKMSGVPFSIIRSSLIFGHGDEFFTKLRRLLRLTPFVLPIAGSGRAQFQPIAVEDVAECVLRVLERGPRRGVTEIGGPDHLSYEEMLGVIADHFTHWPRVTVRVPVMALGVASHVPNPFVTPSQVKMLKKNNITRQTAVRDTFGFEPQSFAGSCDYLADY